MRKTIVVTTSSRPDLLSDDKLVLSVILAFQRGAEGCCTLKQADIGTLCGLSQKTINLSIARLAGRDKARKHQKTACYRFPIIHILLHRNPTTGHMITAYRASTDKDSPCWWMQEAEAGNSTVPLSNRRPERNTRTPKNALAFPAKKTRHTPTKSRT